MINRPFPSFPQGFSHFFQLFRLPEAGAGSAAGRARGQEERGGMRPQGIRAPGPVGLQVTGAHHLGAQELEQLMDLLVAL